MPLFRKKDPTSSALAGYASASPADRGTLTALVSAGADLTQARHVRHYVYVPDESTARVAAAAAGEAGWQVEVREPLPGRTEWLVLSQRQGYVLSPAAVAEGRVFFDALAANHSGEYDGWEASV